MKMGNEKLRFQRARAGLSQSQLSKLSGINVKLIQHYEQGFRDFNNAQLKTILKIALSLN